MYLSQYIICFSVEKFIHCALEIIRDHRFEFAFSETKAEEWLKQTWTTEKIFEVT